MIILYCRVGELPEILNIDGSLSTMQELVGGYIQTLYIDDEVALVCNEEGKINGSKPNRFAFDKEGKVIDIIFGDFFIIGAPMDSDDFGSLNAEQLQKYIKQYGDVADGWLRG